MIGAVAKTQWLPASLERDAGGYICTGRDITSWSLDREPFALETSIPGIFCAGDVRHGSVKRVASGVGEGSMAIAYIHEYLALAGRRFASSRITDAVGLPLCPRRCTQPDDAEVVRETPVLASLGLPE